MADQEPTKVESESSSGLKEQSPKAQGKMKATQEGEGQQRSSMVKSLCFHDLPFYLGILIDGIERNGYAYHCTGLSPQTTRCRGS